MAEAFLDNPYPVYRLLRDRDPLHWIDETKSWLITRYRDVADLFPRYDLLSNFGFQANDFRRLRPELRDVTTNTRGSRECGQRAHV